MPAVHVENVGLVAALVGDDQVTAVRHAEARQLPPDLANRPAAGRIVAGVNREVGSRSDGVRMPELRHECIAVVADRRAAQGRPGKRADHAVRRYSANVGANIVPALVRDVQGAVEAYGDTTWKRDLGG